MTPQIGADTIRPRYPHLHPEALAKQDNAEAAQAQALDDYVADWLDGSLYDDGEVYSAPIERLTEDDWLATLLAARDDEALLQAARIVQSKLRQFVEEQAAE